MARIATSVLVLAVLLAPPSAGRDGRDEKKPDRTIEIVREEGRIVFREQGAPRGGGKPRAVGVVVGETIRWVNRDAAPHRLKTAVKLDGEPVFDTRSIPPGGHKDVVFDVEMYGRLGGRPAQYVTIKYRADDRADDEGELTFLSAARR